MTADDVKANLDSATKALGDAYARINSILAARDIAREKYLIEWWPKFITALGLASDQAKLDPNLATLSPLFYASISGQVDGLNMFGTVPVMTLQDKPVANQNRSTGFLLRGAFTLPTGETRTWSEISSSQFLFSTTDSSGTPILNPGNATSDYFYNALGSLIGSKADNFMSISGSPTQYFPNANYMFPLSSDSVAGFFLSARNNNANIAMQSRYISLGDFSGLAADAQHLADILNSIVYPVLQEGYDLWKQIVTYGYMAVEALAEEKDAEEALTLATQAYSFVAPDVQYATSKEFQAAIAMLQARDAATLAASQAMLMPAQATVQASQIPPGLDIPSAAPKAVAAPQTASKLWLVALAAGGFMIFGGNK